MKTIIINNAGPRGPQGPQGATGPSGSDANVPPLIISSSKQFTDITSPFTGSFTGSFAGDGSNLINVPASGVVGLNLSQISSGTATASISEAGGLFVNTHITASGDISASSGTVTALTGSFNHIITDDQTLEFKSKSSGARIGQLKFNATNGLEIQDPAGARAKIRAARGEFLSLEAGPVGMNSIGSITASSDISASGKFIGDGSGLTNVFENTAVSSSLSNRITTSETNITNLQTDSSSFSTRITTNTSNASTNNAAFDNRITANETNISSGRALITGITSSLSTTGRMVFVGASGILTSEAGFEYNATTNQLSVDNLNVNHLTSSFITASRIFTSGSNIFGDASDDVQTLIGTTKISGSAQVTGSLNISGIITGNGSGLTNVFEGTTASSSISTRLTTQEIKTIFSGSFSGSYEGNGSGLTNIPATGIVGLNLSQIASGSATASISPNSGLVVNTNVSSSIASTASFGTYLGDGSNLSGILTTSFPFSGSAVITGSLIVSQSIVDFSNASSVVLPAATQPLINPEVRYFTTAVITGSGTTVPIPGGLTFISSSVYEYMEIFINGLRLRYDVDFIPMSTASVQYTFAVPVGSEITYKSLKRP